MHNLFPKLQLVSDFNGEDRFMSRIGVGGLINLQKMHQAHIVLNDIQVLHDHAKNSKQGTAAAAGRRSRQSSERFAFHFGVTSDEVVLIAQPVKFYMQPLYWSPLNQYLTT